MSSERDALRDEVMADLGHKTLAELVKVEDWLLYCLTIDRLTLRAWEDSRAKFHIPADFKSPHYERDRAQVEQDERDLKAVRDEMERRK